MHPRWLNRGEAGIGVASFLSDVNHEVPTVLLPSLLTTTLGALATIQSFANLAASAVAGVLWTLVSPRAAVLYLAGWAAVNVVALAAVRR